MLRSQISANIAYGVGRIATSAGLFLLMPFLVNALTPEQFGTWTLLEIAILLGGMFVVLGLDVGLMAVHWKLQIDEDRARMASTILLCVGAWGAAFLAAVGVPSVRVAGAVLGVTRTGWWWTLATVWAESTFAVVLSIFRVREQAITFAVLSTARSLLFVLLSIVLVVQGQGISGAVAGRFVGSVLVGCAAMVIAIRRNWLGSPTDIKGLRSAMRYGVPLLPGNLSSYVLLASDRFFLGRLADLATVGIYSFAYKVGSMLDGFVNRPFAADWAPRRFRIATESDPARRYVQGLVVYVYAAVGFGLLIWASTPAIYEALAPAVYLPGMGVVPVVLLAVFLFGLSYPLNVGIMLEGRTEQASLVGIFAASVCIFLNAWLIPRHGMLGAAWATVLSYALYTASMLVASLRLYPIRYPARPFAAAGFLLVGGGVAVGAARAALAQQSPYVVAGAGLLSVMFVAVVTGVASRRGLRRQLGSAGGSHASKP